VLLLALFYVLLLVVCSLCVFVCLKTTIIQHRSTKVQNKPTTKHNMSVFIYYWCVGSLVGHLLYFCWFLVLLRLAEESEVVEYF